jgi:hypothetical protein
MGRQTRGKEKKSSKRKTQKGGNAPAPAPAPAPAAPFPLVVNDPTSQIKVFTNADKSQATLEAMIAALKRHKFSYEVLGYAKPWHGFHTRMENYEEALNRNMTESGPDSLCIFVDGFDAICIKDSEAVLAAYKAKPRKMPIVFGAEICCLDNCDKNTLSWYDHHKLKGGSAPLREKLEEMFPPNKEFLVSKEDIFPNAGFIMGPTGALLDLLKGMRASGNFDDQLAAGHYIAKNPDKVDLDLEAKIVRNKVRNREKLPDEGTPDGPGFLHYPGMRSEADKQKLLALYKQYP